MQNNEFLPKGGLEGSRMGSLLKSTRNTRALPTGTLRYIRSDYPGHLSDEEVSWLRKNGVTTIIDLRDKTEYAEKPCRLETESGFTYYHLPVTGGGAVPESPDSVADAYVKMIDGQMERIICAIVKAESNVLYFCGAGKDRTGVVSAILLKQLGFSDSVIIEDYMKTKDNLLDFLKAFAAEHPEVNIHTILPREENIKKVLAALSQIEEKAQSVFTGEADIKKRNIGSNERGENEMKKILNKLFIIASLGLIVAGAIFLCVSIFDGNETTTPLAIAVVCILLSNLFNVIRMNMDKK